MEKTLKLVICEKPSVAKSIADVLGAIKRDKGFYEGCDYLVSWCFGHLVELAAPAVYGKQHKRWSKSELPIIPMQWQFSAAADKQEQLDILRHLMFREDVTAIVNGCDAGREGELIFRLVYGYCNCTKPIKRLWISSLENSAILDGFDNLKDGKDYESLYQAALCRAQADWLVGINATRLFSCLYGSTLNVGRVLSPTLAMIVEREVAVEAFLSRPFYTPTIDTGTFVASSERLESIAEAEAIVADCDGKDATVITVEKKEKAEAAPKLYDLTTLQRDANRIVGYSAQQTLDAAQSLYEKKLATYPRTDSRFLTQDMESTALDVIATVREVFAFADSSLMPDVSQVINDAAVSDHHAIIPTLQCANSDLSTLTDGERTVLSLIAARLLSAVAGPHRFKAVTATLQCGSHHFNASGKSVIDDGWKAIDAALMATLKEKADDDEESDKNSLPELADGQVFSSISAFVKEGKTSPPKRFSEDTLLGAMEVASADEFPDNAEHRGLGTPATRASIIEKLIKSAFIERKKKLLVPTQKGTNLCGVLPDDIKSAKLTAKWEQQLKQVENNELPSVVFLDGIKQLTTDTVDTHQVALAEYASLFASPPKGTVVGKCPRCGADVVESSKGFFCSDRSCRFALWKDSTFWLSKGKKLDQKTAVALLDGGGVFFSDLISKKTNKPYSATILLADDGKRVNYTLEFEKARKTA
jgi:DNA topoisomerase-3